MPDDPYHDKHEADADKRFSRLFRSDEGESAAGLDESGASRFPNIEALKALNRRIHDDAGTPERYRLDQPAPLLSCLDRLARSYDPDGSPQGLITVAAGLAHGIAQAQSFFDGNRRTAYFATRRFLEVHGLGHLSRADTSDDMLVRRLNQVVDAQTKLKQSVGPGDFETIFLRRLARSAKRPQRSDS